MERTETDQLTDAERRFVEEYIVTGSPRKALAAVGMSMSTAGRATRRIMNRPHVAGAIRAGFEAQALRLEEKADEVAMESMPLTQMMSYPLSGTRVTRHLPRFWFVYHLLKGEEVVYAGFTRCMYQRIMEHKSKGIISGADYDSCRTYVVYCTQDHAQRLESIEIARHQPRLNKDKSWGRGASE